jgi:hypothetical protein
MLASQAHSVYTRPGFLQRQTLPAQQQGIQNCSQMHERPGDTTPVQTPTPAAGTHTLAEQQTISEQNKQQADASIAHSVYTQDSCICSRCLLHNKE